MANKKESRWRDVDGGSAFIVPYTLLRHPNFRRLSVHVHKLVHDLARQYTGFNNGYLCASWSLMRDEGWRSPETLMLAVKEAEHYGIIERTQQGGQHKPNLHAFTWRRIDQKADRPLDRVPTLKPNDNWKTPVNDFDSSAVRAAIRSRRRQSK